MACPHQAIGGILLPAASPLDSFRNYIQDGTIGLGCVLHIPPENIPDQILRPDGTCGLQLAGFALLTETDRPSRPSDGFFDSPNNLRPFRQVLQDWTSIPRLDSSTLAKVKGTLAWSSRRGRMLPRAHWFSNADIYRVARRLPGFAL